MIESAYNPMLGQLHRILQLYPRRRSLSQAANTAESPLDDLRKEIDSKNYAVRVSVANVPRPVKSNAIDPVKAAKWVEAHPTERTRRAAQALVDATNHFSQGKFETGLENAVRSVNPALAEGGEYAALLIPRRSNQWVTELAMPSLDQLPAQVYDINTLPPEGLSLFRRFVLFDDAGYSGLHMTSMIK